jgi:hypothetical protein
MNIYAFTILTILGLAVLLPLHLTGTLPPAYTTPQTSAPGATGTTPDAGLVYTTVQMISVSPERMSGTIILTFFFILTIFLFCVIYYACHPITRTFNYRQHDERVITLHGMEMLKPSAYLFDRIAMQDSVFRTNTKEALLLCPYTLELDGLPSTLVSQSAFRTMVASVLNREEPNKFGSTAEDIIVANIVLDIEDRLKLHEQRNEILKNIDHLNWENNEKIKDGREVKPPKKSLLCSKFDGKRKFKTSVDAQDYWNSQLIDVDREISRWDQQYAILSQQTGESMSPVGVAETEVGEISESGVMGGGEKATRIAGLPNKFLDKKGNDKEYKIKGAGNGYIVFRTLAALKDFERNFLKSRPKLNDALAMQEQQLGKAATESGVGAIGSKLTGGLSTKAMSFAMLRKNRVKYEPDDVMWDNLFIRNRGSRAMPLLRKVISITLIVLLLIFCSTPAAFASTIQRLLEGGVFPGININNIGFLTSGALGALIFQYLPTLLLLLASILIPMIIIALTMFEKNKSRGQIQTLILKRIYVYLILSTAVLPILVQASMDGLVNGFVNGGANYALIFGNIFLPNGGAFFINYILQKLLIGNMLGYVMIGLLIKYLIGARFTTPYWKKLKMYRYMTPLEHLDSAEAPDLNIEMAYANLLAVMGLGLLLSVLTPIIIPCCFVFFVVQYWVDRYNVSWIYGQRKLVYAVNGKPNIIGSAAYGVRSDFISHMKVVSQVIECVFANMIIFTIFITLFFAARIADNNGFIGHTVVAGLLAIFAILGAIVTPLITKFYLLQNARLDRVNGEVRPNENNVGKGYDPTTIEDFSKIKGSKVGSMGFQLIQRGVV